MLFNSIDFAIFLPIVFILYWFITSRNLKFQNLLIVVASYIFYGWWNWIFLSLIFYSTVIDYFVGQALSTENNIAKRKILLCISIFFNIGFLGIFKYYNFFIDNFISAFSLFGADISPNTLNLILPVGISFYTFQTLSYTIDVYKNKLKPTKDFIAFSAFVSFFPQLVAGPIERATNLLPQFYKKRVFDYNNATDGLRQILWGFFKKIVIADNCAKYADLIFNNSENYSGSSLLLGAVLFSFQIYGDFSGYSDIAIGTSRLFGFNLMQNFAFPYFSRDIAEFWRRWHISLSTWFRDYVYIPLGGSYGSTFMKVRNIFIVFLISGFWHGANWTFIFWGLLHAIFFLPLLLRNKNRSNLEIVAKGKKFPTIKEICNITFTFSLVLVGWIFFRSENIYQGFLFVSNIFSDDLFTTPYLFSTLNLSSIIFLIFILIFVEWLGRNGKHALENIPQKFNKFSRWVLYTAIIIIIYNYGSFENHTFIYFQF
ncbi:MAG: MBOAT family protein [Candidatus Delongbacteria bacterium]|jgi:alginate O-acetyltransferase complex protein AlgI|nr:MBOAT family protein [Candidatus Delongbacteria bacterium]